MKAFLLLFFGHCICFNKLSWALCPLTINFLFCFIFISAVIVAELSLALLHWNQTGFFWFCSFNYFFCFLYHFVFLISLTALKEIIKLLKVAPRCSLCLSELRLFQYKAGLNLADIKGFVCLIKVRFLTCHGELGPFDGTL